MTDLSSTFQHEAVAEAYRHRPPYPEEVFDRLEALITEEPRTVLDIGAGEGAIARPLAPRVGRIDAVDISQAMVDAGRARPGGDHPGLHWQVSGIESADLHGPYALVTAGASIHWMPWEETFARIVPHLTPNAQLVVIEHGPTEVPWRDAMVTVIERHSRNPGYDPKYDVAAAIHDRGLLELTGKVRTSPQVFRQSVADYIEQFHSTSSLARELMSAEEAAEFDAAMERAVTPFAQDGLVELQVAAELTWGRPLAP